jgi:hypothetical protein
MRMKIVIAFFAGVLVSGASAMLAAPEQTLTPGQMTQARVWVQNRGANEAVPIDLREENLASPLHVQIMNGALGRSNPVPVRVLPESWQYRSVLVTPDQDPALALTPAGASGWETTGLTFNRPDGVLVLLRQPR